MSNLSNPNIENQVLKYYNKTLQEDKPGIFQNNPN